MRSGRSSCLEFGTGRTRRSRRNQAASDVPRGLRSYRTGELEIGLSRSGVVNSVLCYFPVTLFLDRCIYITKLDANQLKFFQGLTQGKAKNLVERPDRPVSRLSLSKAADSGSGTNYSVPAIYSTVRRNRSMHAIAGRAFGWLLCQAVDCQLRAENVNRIVDVEGSGVASLDALSICDRSCNRYKL